MSIAIRVHRTGARVIGVVIHLRVDAGIGMLIHVLVGALDTSSAKQEAERSRPHKRRQGRLQSMESTPA